MSCGVVVVVGGEQTPQHLNTRSPPLQEITLFRFWAFVAPLWFVRSKPVHGHCLKWFQGLQGEPRNGTTKTSSSNGSTNSSTAQQIVKVSLLFLFLFSNSQANESIIIFMFPNCLWPCFVDFSLQPI